MSKPAFGSATGSNEEHVGNHIHIAAGAEGNSSFPIVNNCALVDEMHLVPWVIDSGATDHICNNLKFFDAYHDIRSIAVRLANGNSICVNKASTIRINPDLVLKDVLYLPEFDLNLVSIPKLAKGNACRVSLLMIIVSFRTTQRMIGQGKFKQGLYHLDCGGGNKISVVSNISVGSHISPIPNSILCHYRFGHASNAKIGMLCKHFSDVYINKDLVCHICHFSRQRKLPFSASTSRATIPFELVHIDVLGPCSLPSIHAYKYFLNLVDDHNRFTWIVLLKHKSEVKAKVHEFLVMVEN